jgi:hypothetical protein
MRRLLLGNWKEALIMKDGVNLERLVSAPQSFDLLRKLIEEMDGPPGWTFDFVSKQGAPFFYIYVPAQNNYDPSQERTTRHEHPVPWADFKSKTWRKWLFDRCRASMDHEMGEMVRWGDLRPFAPTHGPGEDPYTVREYRDPIDALTTQDGSVRISHGSQQLTTRENMGEEVLRVLREEMWR